MTASIVDFYNGAAKDHRGRSLDEILRWSDDRLEAVHDYIQWLFPLPEPSPVNPYAPLLTLDAVQAFEARPELRARLRASLQRMLEFYGFELCELPLEVIPAGDFRARAAHWLRPGNHNHLRITRILKCCGRAGLKAEARAFLDALEGVNSVERQKPRPGITAESLRYWREALE